MFINKKEQIDFLNKKGDKKVLIDNFEKINNDIFTNTDLIEYKKEIDEETKIIEKYSHKKQTSKIFHYYIQKYDFTILQIISNDNIINFIIREDKKEREYFNTYLNKNNSNYILELSNNQIIDKLDKYDFLIYNKNNIYNITLLHLTNDFTINYKEIKKELNALTSEIKTKKSKTEK